MARGLRIALMLSLLAGLVVFGKVHQPAITLPMCLKNPRQFDGREVEISTEVRVRQVLADGFIIEQMRKRIRVLGDPAGLRTGDQVSLIATFHADGWLEAHKLHIAKGRIWKIWLSLLPVLAVGIVLLCKYRFDWHQWIILER